MPNELGPIRHLRIIAPNSPYASQAHKDSHSTARFEQLMSEASALQSSSNVPLDSIDEQRSKGEASGPRERSYLDAFVRYGPNAPEPCDTALGSPPTTEPDADTRNLCVVDVLPGKSGPDCSQNLLLGETRFHRPNAKIADRSGGQRRERCTPTTKDGRLLDSEYLGRRADLNLDSIVDQVASFSTRAAFATAENAITIKLDPDLLPETTLRVSISRSGLSIRFESPLLRSRTLIYAHANGLALRLESRVRRPTSITVSA
jgi:hypothetical protein